jgi:type I restriction enzyme R subunit
LTEDELEIFDLLTKDKMTQGRNTKGQAGSQVPAASPAGRTTQSAGAGLVQGYADQEAGAFAVEQVLDAKLPDSYDRVLFREKCDNVFYLMLDYASHGRKWVA